MSRSTKCERNQETANYCFLVLFCVSDKIELIFLTCG